MISISMLLPARGRPANLKSSIESVYDLAASPDEVEVIVRLDDDDPHLRQEAEVLRAFPEVREIHVAVDRRVGYARMYEMYNWTASVARGQYLFVWNDDIEMRTQNWDQLLQEAPLFSVQFPRRDTVERADPTLPVVGRPFYEAMGHMSQNAFCDAWISDISAFAGTSINRNDIVFTHHRLNDATLREADDGGKEWARFGTQRAERRADMDKVMAAPGYSSRHDGWDLEVEYHPVDYINLAAGECKARAYQIKGRR